MEHLVKCFVVGLFRHMRLIEIGYVMANDMKEVCEKTHCQMIKKGIMRLVLFKEEVFDFHLYECDEARKNNLKNDHKAKESWGELSGSSLRELLAVIDLD